MLKRNGLCPYIFLCLFLLALFFPHAVAAQGGHSMFVGGPWEILVKMGSDADGPGLTFPFSVEDESKAQPLDKELPILGTPMKLQLQKYLPDLKWETSVTKKAGAGIVAQLSLGGDNLDQTQWLTTDDPTRSSISSKGVGSVAIKKFQNENIISDLAKQLNQGDILGVLSVGGTDEFSGQDFVIRLGTEIALQGSPYTITVLQYFPHYSLDTATGEVANASDKPMNPAVLVKVDDGKETYEQWHWAKFPSFSHQDTPRPLSMEFLRFDLEQKKFNYILMVAPKTKPWLMSYDGQQIQLKPVSAKDKIPFTGNYYFQVKEVFEQSVIVESWKNGQDVLLKPALIATVQEGETNQEIVLPLNKPQRIQSGSSGVLFVFKSASRKSK